MIQGSKKRFPQTATACHWIYGLWPRLVLNREFMGHMSHIPLISCFSWNPLLCPQSLDIWNLKKVIQYSFHDFHASPPVGFPIFPAFPLRRAGLQQIQLFRGRLLVLAIGRGDHTTAPAVEIEPVEGTKLREVAVLPRPGKKHEKNMTKHGKMMGSDGWFLFSEANQLTVMVLQGMPNRISHDRMMAPVLHVPGSS